MNIYWWIGCIVCVILLLALIDVLAFSFLSFNSHRIFHPERYEIALPEKLKSSSEHQTIEKGKMIAKTKKIVIACLARNAAHIFDKASKRIEMIGELFGDYKVLLFENDSVDRTRSLLKIWTHTNPQVELLDCDDLGCKDCKFNLLDGYALGAWHGDRMKRMAFLRNRYLSHFKDHCNHDYLMVYDFDLDGGISKEGILHSIGCESQWDAVFANGRMRLPPFGISSSMYDGLAFVSSRKTDDLGIVARFIELSGLNEKGLLPVASAFNGLAIYKKECLRDARYHSVNDKLNCEHVGLHYDMIDAGYNRLYINSHMELEAGPQGPKNKFTTFFSFLFH